MCAISIINVNSLLILQTPWGRGAEYTIDYLHWYNLDVCPVFLRVKNKPKTCLACIFGLITFYLLRQKDSVTVTVWVNMCNVCGLFFLHKEAFGIQDYYKIVNTRRDYNGNRWFWENWSSAKETKIQIDLSFFCMIVKAKAVQSDQSRRIG